MVSNLKLLEVLVTLDRKASRSSRLRSSRLWVSGCGTNPPADDTAAAAVPAAAAGRDDNDRLEGNECGICWKLWIGWEGGRPPVGGGGW